MASQPGESMSRLSSRSPTLLGSESISGSLGWRRMAQRDTWDVLDATGGIRSAPVMLMSSPGR
eukprot:12168391-Heterocapsa_arctica.AAC.1